MLNNFINNKILKLNLHLLMIIKIRHHIFKIKLKVHQLVKDIELDHHIKEKFLLK